MTRVLVCAADVIGAEMSSSGIRSYEFSRALANHFDVTLMTSSQPVGVELPFETRLWTGTTRELLRYDAIVAQALPPGIAMQLAKSDATLIFDLYIPAVIESAVAARAVHSWRSRAYARAASASHRMALQTGNAFVCASERQRDALLEALAVVGRITPQVSERDPSLRGIVDVVPFGLPDEPPPTEKARVSGVRADDFVLLWAGGIVDWLDPITPIRAMAEVIKTRPDVKLVFLSLRTPDGNLTAQARRALEAAQSLGLLNGTVFFNERWVPYADRGRYLVGAHVGISAHQDHVESRYAFRTRFLDHFWAGLPTIATQGDTLADLIAEERLGLTVPPGDVPAWVRAIHTLAADEQLVSEQRRNIEAIRPRFRWSKVVAPLLRMATTPGPRPAAVPFRARAMAAATHAEVALMLRAGRLRPRRFTLW